MCDFLFGQHGEGGLLTYTVANHQGAISTFGLSLAELSCHPSLFTVMVLSVGKGEVKGMLFLRPYH